MHTSEYERLQGVLADAEQPMTAKEIVASLDDPDVFSNPHRVATVLGRWADRGEVEVQDGSPYRYRLTS